MKLIRGFLFENDKLQMVFYRIGMRKRIIVCKVSLLLVLKSKIPEGKSYFRLDRLNITKACEKILHVGFKDMKNMMMTTKNQW